MKKIILFAILTAGLLMVTTVVSGASTSIIHLSDEGNDGSGDGGLILKPGPSDDGNDGDDDGNFNDGSGDGGLILRPMPP